MQFQAKEGMRYLVVSLLVLVAIGHVIQWRLDSVSFEMGYACAPFSTQSTYLFVGLLAAKAMILVVSFFVVWKLAGRRTFSLADFGIFVCVVCIVLTSFLIATRPKKSFLSGFQSRLDDVGLSSNTIAKYLTSDSAKLPKPPDQLRTLSPNKAFFLSEEFIAIEWGSGFRHWGVLIPVYDSDPTQSYSGLLTISETQNGYFLYVVNEDE